MQGEHMTSVQKNLMNLTSPKGWKTKMNNKWSEPAPKPEVRDSGRIVSEG